jgi:hypothetical protein
MVVDQLTRRERRKIGGNLSRNASALYAMDFPSAVRRSNLEGANKCRD